MRAKVVGNNLASTGVNALEMLAVLVATSLVFGQDTPANPIAKGPAAEILKLTNAAREREGLTPLRIHGGLTKAAQAHAADMAKQGYFDHTSRDGLEMVDRVRRVSYRFSAIAENIAMGQTSAKQAVEGWLRSPGHRQNMLNPAYRGSGGGFCQGPEGIDSLGSGFWDKPIALLKPGL